HRVNVIGKVHDFRLPGNIFKMCHTFCQTRRHDQILCGTDTWEIEVDFGSLQTAVCRTLKTSIHRPEGNTHFFKAFNMLLDGSSTNSTSTRHRHIAISVSCKHGTHHKHACTHLADKIKWGVAVNLSRGVNSQ